MGSASLTQPTDPAALAEAVADLGMALAALQAHDQAVRAASHSRAALREKARTGRLKPVREMSAALVADDNRAAVPVDAGGTQQLPDIDQLVDRALSAIVPTPPASPQEPA